MKLISFVLAGMLVSSSSQAEDLEALLSGENESTPMVEQKQTSSFTRMVSEKIGTTTPDQNAFLRDIENQKWNEAALLFEKAVAGTTHQNSSWGRALLTYLQFKSGLHVTAVETLFTAEHPQELGSLGEAWAKLVPENHFVWKIARIKWSEGWNNVFSRSIEAFAKLRAIETLDNVEAFEKVSKESPVDSLARAQSDWNLILAYSLQDKADVAAKLLAKLMNNKNSPATQDLMKLTAARLLFQNGYFDASIRYYEQVSKSSEYWVEAQEETAWAHVRKGEPQNSIAVTKSLMMPVFLNQLRPEAYLVGSLASLKVCDYAAVARTIEKFPKAFKDRTAKLEGVASELQPQTFAFVFNLLKTKKIQTKDLGKYATELPRLTVRDEKLYHQAQAVKHLEAEAAAAEKLYIGSIALTGLQGSFEAIKNSVSQRAQAAKAAAQMRIKDLAKAEVEEIKSILRKMHIVEAEMVQQVVVAEKDKKATTKSLNAKKGSTGAKGKETISFPADSEIWIDEIGNYKVDIKKACVYQGDRVIK